MTLFFRILIFVGTTALGILILKYQRKIVDMVGHNQWADEHLGMGSGGGTYLLWTILGLLVIIAGVYILLRGW